MERTSRVDGAESIMLLLEMRAGVEDEVAGEEDLVEDGGEAEEDSGVIEEVEVCSFSLPLLSQLNKEHYLMLLITDDILGGARGGGRGGRGGGRGGRG